MSARYGDHFIMLSKTLALNRIRKDEEFEKGWRKGDFGVPTELRDLDLVHVFPLERVETSYLNFRDKKYFFFNSRKIDLGRLLLILVTRSINLSNTLYSVLLEAEGKFLTLGREWIGSLVKYEEPSICYSNLFANDLWYTGQSGQNNDECEYFGNGIINDEKLFIQNYVFDFTFEIEFDFGKDLKFENNIE